MRRDRFAAIAVAPAKLLLFFATVAMLVGSSIWQPNTAVAGGTWSPTGSMATARVEHTATLLANGKVLVAGGSNATGALASAELYDPASGTWSATGTLTTARYAPTATLLANGKVLVVGGFGVGNPLVRAVASAELYDPANGTWSLTGSMASARVLHTATLLPSGKVLVAGGQDDVPDYLRSAELYDPATGTWTTTGSMAMARELHTATPLPNGKVLVAGGGNTTGALASAELYDPASGSWSATGSMATGREFYTATMLIEGKVLVAGGDDFWAALASAEVYDPTSGTWTATGNMTTARVFPLATLLPSGKVLVAGGDDLSGSLAGAELYDPVTGMWSATGSMTTGRIEHTATLLANGEVLVAGGQDGGSALASAELYAFTGMSGCQGDSDCDGCPDTDEALLVPPTDPHNPWDFYSVPVPALLVAPDPGSVFRDNVMLASDAQAVFAYFKAGAKAGAMAYEQDLNLNDVRDGLEYDRSVVGPGRSGAPDGAVTAQDAQLAFAQFKAGYSCQ